MDALIERLCANRRADRAGKARLGRRSHRRAQQRAQPLVVLMHGDRQVSTKALARQINAKHIEPCTVETAQRHSGYLVGGTSPFGLRRAMPIYIERSILDLPRIAINGGRRGYLLGLDPQVCVQLLKATPVDCALPL